ncbi:hypothetical protein [Alloacidobacterium sp.]|uniref:hypothetical protein n=1 Tax=Alloacidobacterium sp. TaxID=2951999 RepID=UPI002D61A917|nr:hypothetical protein [Alloacidobacterium sp.]HYK38231.1 hypothetical protein [Alloacidobacterium sp.]
MRAIAHIAVTLISALAWNAWAFQSAPPASVARAPYIPAPHGNTKIAIAWFSEVSGEVELASAYGKDFQRALDHTAIAQGNVIRTGMGRAEVELQDQSTIRVGPDSIIVFPRLELLPSGTKEAIVRGLRGTIYVSLIPNYIVNKKGNDFVFTFGQQQVYLQSSGHVRLEINDKEARLALLDGKGRVEGPFGAMELARKKTFTFDLTEPSQPGVEKKIKANLMDKWDTAAVAFHQDQIATPSRIARGFYNPP